VGGRDGGWVQWSGVVALLLLGILRGTGPMWAWLLHWASTTQVPATSTCYRQPTPAAACRLLWFKRRLPRYATRFIEMCVVLCADHGPCVSGELLVAYIVWPEGEAC
jgi:hypothetical protein